MSVTPRWTDSKQLIGVAKHICATLVRDCNAMSAWLYCYDPDRLSLVRAAFSGGSSHLDDESDLLPSLWPVSDKTNFTSPLFGPSNSRSLHFVEADEGQFSKKFLVVPLISGSDAVPISGVVIVQVSQESTLQNLATLIKHVGIRRTARFIDSEYNSSKTNRYKDGFAYLSDALQSVVFNVDDDVAFSDIARIASAVVRGNSARIVVLDHAEGSSTLVGSHGPLGGVVGRRRSSHEGVAGFVAQNQSPVLIFHRSKMRYYPMLEGMLEYLESIVLGAESIIVVPLIGPNDEVVGVLGVLSEVPETFDLVDLEILLHFARSATVAFERAKLRRSASRRFFELEALISLVDNAKSDMTPREIANLVIDALELHGEFAGAEVALSMRDGELVHLANVDFGERGREPRRMTDLDDASVVQEKIPDMKLFGEGGSTIDLSARPRGGSKGPTADFVNVLEKLLSFIVVSQDRLYRIDSLLRAAESEAERFRAITANLRDMVGIIDLAGTVEFASPSVAKLLDIDEAELVGVNLFSFLGANEVDLVIPYFENLVSGFNDGRRNHMGSLELKIVSAKGRPSWILLNVEPMKSNDGSIAGFVLSATDISERRELIAHVRDSSSHDSLTNLENRASLLSRMHSDLGLSPSAEDSIALIVIDLDEFSNINHLYGESICDEVLVMTAMRIRAKARPGEVVARIGGDEFALFLPRMDADGTALLVAEELKREISQPIETGKGLVIVTASIGVAMASKDIDASGLLRMAESATYRAKYLGKARVEVYEGGIRADDIRYELQMIVDLRNAVTRGELYVMLQPVFAPNGSDIAFFEVLARWDCPSRGAVPPYEFITASERHNYIIPLGWSIVELALDELKKWRNFGSDMRFSINFSSLQFLERGFCEKLVESLFERGLNQGDVIIEVTESASALQSSEFQSHMRHAVALGFQIALDDFGVGNSTIDNLRKLPFSILKIDKSYVLGDNSGTDATRHDMLPALFDIAKAARLMIVAEGVETAAHLDRVVALNTDYVQGYLFSKPLKVEEALELALKAK
ncbi:MAG: EAL domain-containing protein [Actinomycetota bacterium]|nr:EAL domain-containing protein [Actinomycetota bacterium]